MKVTTDACLFGAVAASSVDIVGNKKYILDIGTGTGLLALMFAQKNRSSKIDAVEIDQAAYLQASANVSNSEFAGQVNVINADIKLFKPNYSYDLIISNPPFFERDLKGSDEQKNKALHDTSLTLNDLLLNSNRLVGNNGCFIVLLPYHRVLYFINLAKDFDWYCTKQINVKQTENHAYFRSILFFHKSASIFETEAITIKEAGNYTKAFREYLEDYYLFL